MASIPISGTNIYLLKDVPFSNDYKHTRWFDTLSEQTTYFLNKPRVHSISESTFQRTDERTYIKVNLGKDALWETNYVMFQNAEYNNKWFYAFVTSLEYVNPGLTRVHFQLDVFQTWRFEMNFQPSYVSREHRPLWNSDGSPVINTLDEGLHYGLEYETVDVQQYKPFEDVYFLVIVSKTANHSGGISNYNNKILPTVNGIPQPLTYYVHPFRIQSGGSITQPNVTVSGEDANITDIVRALELMFEMDDTVNNIVSLYITDYIGDDSITYNASTDTLNFSPATNYKIANFSDGTNSINTIYVENIDQYTPYIHNAGNKYNGFRNVSESKLLMYPYTVTILTDFKGNQIELKNEYIDSSALVIYVNGSMGTQNKTSYYVPDYLTDLLTVDDRIKVGMEHALINSNPNSLPILNDYLSAFLQGNINSMKHQLNSNVINSIFNTAGSAVGGIGSVATRNPLGILSSGVGVGQGLVNTRLAIEGNQAKLKDIANTPPNVTSMGGNTSFEYGNGYHGVYVIKKQITQEYQNKLEDYFNMYGYKTNETKIPNFHTRQNWNYVETISCVILGNINNEDLQELKNVFDNGITLWHTDDIGNYSLSNEVI